MAPERYFGPERVNTFGLFRPDLADLKDHCGGPGVGILRLPGWPDQSIGLRNGGWRGTQGRQPCKAAILPGGWGSMFRPGLRCLPVVALEQAAQPRGIYPVS